MASPGKRSRVGKRSHARSASAGAILGAAAALTQMGCGGEESAAPPINDARAEGAGPVLDAGAVDASVSDADASFNDADASVSDADASLKDADASLKDAEVDSTLVDLDGEADAVSAGHDGSSDGAGEAAQGGQADAEVS